MRGGRRLKTEASLADRPWLAAGARPSRVGAIKTRPGHAYRLFFGFDFLSPRKDSLWSPPIPWTAQVWTPLACALCLLRGRCVKNSLPCFIFSFS